MAGNRLESSEQLEALRRQVCEKKGANTRRVLICMTGCRARGAVKLARAFREKLEASGLDKSVDVVDVGCLGQCSRAPLIMIEPEEYLYGNVKPKDIDEIIEETLKAGRPVPRLCAQVDGVAVPKAGEIPFYRAQERDVLKDCGNIDPPKKEVIEACRKAMVILLKKDSELPVKLQKPYLYNLNSRFMVKRKAKTLLLEDIFAKIDAKGKHLKDYLI